MKNMHDPSHKKLESCSYHSHNGFHQNFYNRKFLWISKKMYQKSKFLIFVLKILIFILKIAIFVSICYSLSLRVQFSTIFIFDLTILLSVQNRYPKLSKRTSRLSFCKSNFLVCTVFFNMLTNVLNVWVNENITQRRRKLCSFMLFGRIL
jgi:hypothetical protein